MTEADRPAKFASTAIVYHDDGSEAARIWCADGFVSRCVTSIAEHNIPDAIAAAKVLNAAVLAQRCTA